MGEQLVGTPHQHIRKGDTGSLSKFLWPLVLKLVSVVSFLGMAIFGTMWAMANNTKDKVADHDGDIKVIKVKIEAHDKVLDEIHKEQVETNRKIEKVLIYHGIKDDKK